MLVKRPLLRVFSIQIGEICTEEPAAPAPVEPDAGTPTVGGGGSADACSLNFLEPVWVEIDGDLVLVLQPEDPECGGPIIIGGAGGSVG